MSVNCLCIIQQNTQNSSWINVVRLRLEQEKNDEPRYDYIKVYLPNTIAISRVIFKHQLTETQLNSIEKKDSNIKTINYFGMNSESLHQESRALRYGDWFIWNEHLESFNKPLNFKQGEYFFIQFPKNYWSQL